MIPIGDGVFLVEPLRNAGELIAVVVHSVDGAIMGSVFGYLDYGSVFNAEMFSRWLADCSATPKASLKIAGTHIVIENMWTHDRAAAAILFALGRSWDEYSVESTHKVN